MENSTQKKEHYLSIKLDTELFAVGVHKVLEVLEQQQITKVPNVSQMIQGVINFRGEILPVIDTRQKFNMPKRNPEQKYVIIVLELKRNSKQIMLGIIADAVKDVLEINEEDIKEVPDIGNKINTSFLKGMIKMESKFLMLLDVDKVFSAEEIDTINTIKFNE